MPRIPSLPVTGSSGSRASVQLSSGERYLLSLVDGTLDEDELALMTGQTPGDVVAVFDRLAGAGVVVLGGEADRVSAAPKPASTWRPAAGSSPSIRPGHEGAAGEQASQASQAAQAAAVVPGGDSEIDAAKRARIDAMFDRLDDRSYYDLLEVPADADKKQIKAAYYALAPEFHPDKFFRKQLGAYRHKIEAIFGRITLAHDVLTTPEKRADYDAYVAQAQMNRSTSAVLDEGPAEVEAILAAVEKAAAAAARAAKPPSDGVAPPAPAPRISPEDTLRQRREALARKLTGGRVMRPSQTAIPVVVQAPDPAVLARSAEGVRQHQERVLRDARHAQVVRYMDSGKAALQNKDWAIAANNYRIAASLEPDDPQTQAVCAEALQGVAVALADGYWRQGLYEESQERWADAALSFSKVCAGRPTDASAHDRVAQMTVRASVNVRRAVEFARRAIELDPKKPDYHVTLAGAYAAGGMEHSAASELDRALALAPKDARVVAMVSAARSKSGIRVTAAQVASVAAGAAVVSGAPRPPSGEHDLLLPKTDPGRVVVVAPPPVQASERSAAPAPAASSPRVEPPPRKASGLHAFVNAVRSALTPKDGK